MIMLVAFLFCACDESVGYFPDRDGGTDSDSDSDSDTDSDTDSDSDTDACDDITCQDPPDDECQTDGTLHDYNQEADGLCIDGECVYGYETVTCNWGCTVVESDDDKCFDPCEGVVCDDTGDYCEGDLAWHCSPSSCEPTEDGEPECQYSCTYDDCSIYENTCIMWGDFSMCD
jgi:hypothetical protein